jgi:hypothetical protein
MEVWAEDGVEVGLRVKDRRFKVRGGDGGRGRGGGRGRALSQRCQIFMKRSRESNWVIDLIFKLKGIHVREVAYQW